MVRQALILIHEDPRLSPRPAEAIRLAAGIAPWKNVRFTLYLHGPAVVALSREAGAFVDEEHFQRYLPLLGEHRQTVLVEEGQPLLSTLGEPALPFETIKPADLARLAAAQDLVMRF